MNQVAGNCGQRIWRDLAKAGGKGMIHMLKYGMVGGGPGAFIGEAHRKAIHKGAGRTAGNQQ